MKLWLTHLIIPVGTALKKNTFNNSLPDRGPEIRTRSLIN